MTRKFKELFKCERGTQMIEFALALPFLLLVFIGTIEMGRLFKTYTTLQKAGEVGARYLSTASLTGGTYSASDTAIANNLVVCGQAATCSGQDPVAPNLTSSNVNITPPGSGTGTRYVTVQVNYNYSPLILDVPAMNSWNLSLNFTLTPTITMRYMIPSTP
jgi:Flp pilus assembly protein TadG